MPLDTKRRTVVASDRTLAERGGYKQIEITG